MEGEGGIVQRAVVAHQFTLAKDRFINIKHSLDTFPLSYLLFLCFLLRPDFPRRSELQDFTGKF